MSSSSCLLFIRLAFFTLTSHVPCQITVHHTAATTKLNCSPAFHLTCQLVDLHYWQKRRKRRRVFVFFVQHPAERIFANTKKSVKEEKQIKDYCKKTPKIWPTNVFLVQHISFFLIRKVQTTLQMFTHTHHSHHHHYRP